jgi:DNA-binding CsgD family transcriptional regulator
LLPPQVQPPNPESKILDLNEYSFSPKELQCIFYAANNVTYKNMANFLAVSESVIKKTMVRVYATFGIKTRDQFSLMVSQFSLRFPNTFKTPAIYSEN